MGRGWALSWEEAGIFGGGQPEGRAPNMLCSGGRGAGRHVVLRDGLMTASAPWQGLMEAVEGERFGSRPSASGEHPGRRESPRSPETNSSLPNASLN